MQENAQKNPDKILEIQRALQDGDLVAVHSRVRQNPQDRGGAVVPPFEIFPPEAGIFSPAIIRVYPSDSVQLRLRRAG